MYPHVRLLLLLLDCMKETGAVAAGDLFLAVDHQSFPRLGDLAESHRALMAVIESGDMEQIRRELAAHIHSKVPESLPGAEGRVQEAS